MSSTGQSARLSPDAPHRLAHAAARLFRPDLPPHHGEALPEWLLAALPDFFTANALAFVALPESPETVQLRRHSAIAKAWRAEADRFAGLRGEFEVLRVAWQQAGVEPLFIKSGAGVPSFPHLSGNLDVYVLPEVAAAADDVLGRLGFLELPLLREPNKYLYKRFRRGDETCAIHLHLRVEWCVPFMFEDRMWSRRQQAPDDARLFVPSPEDALLITLAHSFYENKRYRLADLLQVDHCLNRDGLDWDYMWSVAEAKGWGAGLAHTLLVHNRLARSLGCSATSPEAQIDRCRRRLRVRHRHWADRRLHRPEKLPFPFGFTFSKALFLEKVLGDRTEPWRWRSRSAIYHLLAGSKLKLRMAAQPRFLITFSGVDGSGKSTVAGATQRALAQSGIRTRYVWSRSGSSGLARLAITGGKRLLGAWPAAPEDGASRTTLPPVEAGRAALLRRPVVRALWPWEVLLELTWTYARKVGASLLLGRVVLCDRYVADALAELGSRLQDDAATTALPSRLLGRLSPTPNVAIFLDVPAEAARLRQAPEIRQGTLELAERQAALLTRMVEESGGTRIDGRQTLEKVTDQVVHSALRRYFVGCRPRLVKLLAGEFVPSTNQSEFAHELSYDPVPIPSAPSSAGQEADNGE